MTELKEFELLMEVKKILDSTEMLLSDDTKTDFLYNLSTKLGATKHYYENKE